MANPKLEPCPFCGSDDIRILPQPYGYSINCEVCHASKMSVTKYKRQAIISWNTRANDKK